MTHIGAWPGGGPTAGEKYVAPGFWFQLVRVFNFAAEYRVFGRPLSILVVVLYPINP